MSLFFKLSVVTLLTALASLPVLAAETSVSPTQRDWMTNLADTLDYSFGLPDQPESSDYQKLLDGRRDYRFEAEATVDPDDLVAINSFKTYGDFSGEGWASGLASPTRIRLHFLLPHAGTYRFFVSIRVPGHVLRLGDQTFQINDSQLQFHRVDLGEVTLAAGAQTLEVNLPPSGSIDYFEFSAPPLPAIAPLGGWEPSKNLSIDDLAVTLIQALQLESMLPTTSETLVFAAGKEPALQGMSTNQTHLGQPEQGTWIRAGASAAAIEWHFPIKQGAVYACSLRAVADRDLTGRIDMRDNWSTTFPPYLESKNIGTWYLAPGDHTLWVQLPPRGGVDTLTLTRKQSTGADFRLLAGLPINGTTPSPEQANRVLTLLSRLRPKS